MVFNLPTLPSGLFTSLIDTSPPVFYPASASKSVPKKDKTSRSRSQSTSTTVQTDSPRRARQASPSRTPSIDGRANGRQLGGLISASASVHDLSGNWEPLPGRGITERRCSIGGPPSPTPVRPMHRRAHSAVPSAAKLTLNAAPPSVPTGRLQEFSRNSLASTSAISLPTLAEGDIDTPSRTARKGGSTPPSPLVRPRRRTSARTSPISPQSPAASAPREDTEEIIELKLSQPANHPKPDQSSVPPPQAQTNAQVSESRSMPPPPLKPMNITYSPSRPKARPPPRPLISPRSWSAQNIHEIDSPQREGVHDRRLSIGSVSSVSISDVAVLATWSFPHRPQSDGADAEGPEGEQRGRRPAPERLKERLRNIPGVETGPIPASTSFPSVGASANVNGPRRANTFIKPSRPLPSHLTSRHRHTHSSPNLLQIPGATLPGSPSVGEMGPPALPTPSPFLPPVVQRRPTTSRLRQPNPLVMPDRPSHRTHNSITSGRELGSSPGSMGSESGSGSISDTSTLCPSPTTSVKSLPGSSAASVKSLQLQTTSGSDAEGEEKAWWAFPGLRGRGISFSRAGRGEGEKEILVEVGGRRDSRTSDSSDRVTASSDVRIGSGGWEVEDDEEYIDLDHM